MKTMKDVLDTLGTNEEKYLSTITMETSFSIAKSGIAREVDVDLLCFQTLNLMAELVKANRKIEKLRVALISHIGEEI